MNISRADLNWSRKMIERDQWKIDDFAALSCAISHANFWEIGALNKYYGEL